MLTEVQKQNFDKDGFLLIKNVLSKEDVKKLREIGLDYFKKNPDKIIYIYGGRTKSSAFDNIPELSFIFDNPKVIELMKDIAGDDVVYGHHSDFHDNMFSGWHKDNYGSNDWNPGDNGQPYKCIKMAFYLQDHSNNSDGLSIRKGSHKLPKCNPSNGEVFDLKSEIGDAVIFDMRLDHVGREPNKLEKVMMKFIKSGKTQYSLFQSLRNLKGIEDKCSVFFGFGTKDRFIYEHINKNISRQNAQNKVSSTIIHPEVAKKLEKAGIDFKY